MPSTRVTTGIGIDGCRGGWLAIRLREDAWDGRIFPSIADLTREWWGPGVLALVDIPIGLPDDRSFRSCDSAARRYLGRRASSVFNPPTRAALAAASYPEAADLNERACGKRLSRQSWFITPKIAEVDRLLRSAPELEGRIREAHPETLFQALNGDEPLRNRKKDAEGRQERLGILEAYFPRARAVFEALHDRYPRKEVAPDDIPDALAAAVVALRFRDSLRTLPEDPERDSAGLVCEMVLPGPLPGLRRGGAEVGDPWLPK